MATSRMAQLLFPLRTWDNSAPDYQAHRLGPRAAPWAPKPSSRLLRNLNGRRGPWDRSSWCAALWQRLKDAPSAERQLRCWPRPWPPRMRSRRPRSSCCCCSSNSSLDTNSSGNNDDSSSTTSSGGGRGNLGMQVPDFIPLYSPKWACGAAIVGVGSWLQIQSSSCSAPASWREQGRNHRGHHGQQQQEQQRLPGSVQHNSTVDDTTSSSTTNTSSGSTTTSSGSSAGLSILNGKYSGDASGAAIWCDLPFGQLPYPLILLALPGTRADNGSRSSDEDDADDVKDDEDWEFDADEDDSNLDDEYPDESGWEGEEGLDEEGEEEDEGERVEERHVFRTRRGVIFGYWSRAPLG